LTTLLIQEQLM